MARIGLIGGGNIGTALVRQGRAKGYDFGPVVTTSGVYDVTGLQSWKDELSDYLRNNPEYRIAKADDYIVPLQEIDAVCLAIPTKDNGETAYKYLYQLLNDGHPASTCEKGALSLHFGDLLEPFENGRLGYRATVGGGTSMLKYMQERVMPGFEGKIYAVVNGTMNFVFDGVSSGRSMGEMTNEARRLGYAEPGAENALDVINEEACGDVPRKSTILFNVFLESLGLDGFITYHLIQPATKRITPNMLKELVRQAGNRRYIVSISRPDGDGEDIIGGYSLEIDGWKLQGGFRPISDDPLYQRLLPRGVDNAILIAEGVDESGGVYNLKGPGAGAIPTANAMLRDLDDMRKLGVIKE